jgi:hypothetical protein
MALNKHNNFGTKLLMRQHFVLDDLLFATRTFDGYHSSSRSAGTSTRFLKKFSHAIVTECSGAAGNSNRIVQQVITQSAFEFLRNCLWGN